jgi:hypothetical protein
MTADRHEEKAREIVKRWIAFADFQGKTYEACVDAIAIALADADRKAEIRTLEWALTQTVDRDGQIANRLAALLSMPLTPGKT